MSTSIVSTALKLSYHQPLTATSESSHTNVKFYGSDNAFFNFGISGNQVLKLDSV